MVRDLKYFVDAPSGVSPAKLKESSKPGKLQLLKVCSRFLSFRGEIASTTFLHAPPALASTAVATVAVV